MNPIELLKDNFENIRHWLSFAEAKNALLVVGNGALLVGASQIVGSEDWDHSSIFFQLYTFSLGYFCILALIVALIALLPITYISQKPRDGSPDDNFLFFENISRYKTDEFLKYFFDAAQQPIPTDLLSRWYAEQIVQNSQIATRKYALFRIAGWLTVVAVGSPIIGLPAIYFLDNKKS